MYNVSGTHTALTTTKSCLAYFLHLCWHLSPRHHLPSTSLLDYSSRFQTVSLHPPWLSIDLFSMEKLDRFFYNYRSRSCMSPGLSLSLSHTQTHTHTSVHTGLKFFSGCSAILGKIKITTMAYRPSAVWSLLNSPAAVHVTVPLLSRVQSDWPSLSCLIFSHLFLT